MSHHHTGKVSAALFALTATLIAALAGSFIVLQSVFPWMTVLNPTAAENDKAKGSDVSRVVDVTHGGPTPAEKTLKAVMATEVPRLADDGWSETTTGGGVPGVSFGFGCSPTDGLAPVVAEGRSWVQTSQTSRDTVPNAIASLTVSARAYPAGGGAVAFDGLTEAVERCEDATAYPSSGLGVETVQVLSGKVAALVWRRGDVIVVGTIQSKGRAGSVSSVEDVFKRFDVALADGLAATCLDPDAGDEQARRSPYVSRADFFGHAKTVRVERDHDPTALTAEDRTTDPVVKIPGEHITLPYVAVLPTAPYPPVLRGPSALPDPVPFPTEPVAPTNVSRDSTGVPRKIADPAGPGCGWDFTGQAAPRFDAAAAKSDYKTDVAAAKRAMARSWKIWQAAKLTYYGAYADYTAAAAAYETYAARVAKVSEAWAVIEAARDDYATALAAYDAAVEALAQWKVDRAEARVEYRAAKQECPDAAAEEPASGEDPEVPSDDPSDEPTTEPEPTEPKMVCPPVRPTILDEEAPLVPEQPVPAPEAQLPAPEPAKND